MELFLAVLPIIVTIVMVLLTKKVKLSLALGILFGIGVVAYNQGSILEALQFFYETVKGIVTDFEWYMPILLFILVVGVATALISRAGGTYAFAEAVTKRVKTRIGGQLVAAVMGLIIFIDDYLNALVIGEISKPITDNHRVSRAKLAYIIDSTSAPVSVLAMFSTWGAFIIGLLAEQESVVNANSSFWTAILYQFYPITAIALVFLTIIFSLNFGEMKKFEENAIHDNDATVERSTEATEVSKNGNALILILPILVLLGSIFFFWFQKAGFNLVEMLDTEITLPLGYASIVTLIFTFVIIKLLNKEVSNEDLGKVAGKSFVSLLLSVGFILVSAWTLAGVMSELETGPKIAEFVMGLGINASFLPAIIFLLAAFIAFSTGSSWATFSIMIPLAIPIAAGIGVETIPMFIAVVLGGGVLGDHCSPISDTTVLSATGAKCRLDAHFLSQLPYAVIAGAISFAAYIVVGFTGQLFLGWIIVALSLCLIVLFNRYNSNK